MATTLQAGIQWDMVPVPGGTTCTGSGLPNNRETEKQAGRPWLQCQGKNTGQQYFKPDALSVSPHGHHLDPEPEE